MKITHAIAAFSMFCLPGLAHAETDNLLWVSAGVRYRPAKDWNLRGIQHIRLMENASSIESINPQVDLEYSPYKWLDISAGYRLIYEAKDDELVRAHRYNGDLKFGHKLGAFKVSYRLRYQEKHKSENLDIIMRVRNRFKLSYDTRTRYFPLLAVETFTDEELNTGKTRLTAGCMTKLSKSHRLTARYHHQTSIKGDERNLERIFRLDYRYRIPKKKTIKKEKAIEKSD